MNIAVTEFLATVIALIAIIDPLGNVGIFASITEQDSHKQRMSQIRRGHLYALALLTVFYFIGGFIMTFFGITIPAVRVAGGLILLKIGFDLLSMHDSTRSSPQEQRADRTRKDVAFFPLAMPLIAGPGALTLVLTKAADESHRTASLMIGDIAAILGALFISFLVLSSMRWMIRVLGVTGMAAVSRIMGFLLVCISVQMVILGIQGILVAPSSPSAPSAPTTITQSAQP